VLKNAVRAAIGPIATPDFIIYSDLPKVRLCSRRVPTQQAASSCSPSRGIDPLMPYVFCFCYLCAIQTRSGKIMRRILRKIAAGEEDSIGDVSTLADPSVRMGTAHHCLILRLFECSVHVAGLLKKSYQS
jgi:hypothetical protein